MKWGFKAHFYLNVPFPSTDLNLFYPEKKSQKLNEKKKISHTVREYSAWQTWEGSWRRKKVQNWMRISKGDLICTLLHTCGADGLRVQNPFKSTHFFCTFWMILFVHYVFAIWTSKSWDLRLQYPSLCSPSHSFPQLDTTKEGQMISFDRVNEKEEKREENPSQREEWVC